MKRRLLICFLILFCASVKSHAQQQDPEYVARVNRYIGQYHELAVEEQKRCGMPAAVILAQAILETEAGNSELVTGANNHFGIKCKSNWKGETYTHTDDSEDECFRKYKTALDSYKDHSDYLKNTPRYASLFKLSITDYAAWAYGLKQCGYATNPIYAQKLIGFIEDYHLQEYTYAAINSNRIYKEALAKSDKIKTDTILKPQILSVVKTDTFTFKKIRKGNDTAIAIKPAKTRDTTLLAKTADSAAQKTALILKAPDTSYPRAITNVAVNNPVVAQTDSSALKKDSVSKPAITKTDTGGQVPANINSQAAANSISVNSQAAQNDQSKIISFHGLRAFYAHKGDMLLEAAVKYNIRYAKLLEINDLSDAPLPNDMYIYLEKKGTEGAHPTHIVQNGETLQEISQAECIQLKRLVAYNLLQPGEMPAVGAKLFLKQTASKKPLLATANTQQNNTAAENSDTANKIRPNIPDHYIAKQATEETPLPVSTTTPPTQIADVTTTSAGAAIVTPGAPDANQQAPVPALDNKEILTNAAAAGDTAKTIEALTESQQEKLAHLKSKLDRVVYSTDTSEGVSVQATQAAQMQQSNIESLPVKAPVVKAVSDSSNYYTVKDGDTIYNIAHRFNITMRQLNSWNNLDSDSGIKKGMKLKVKE